MKSALWLVFGIVLGFLAAHQANKAPQGQAFFDDLNSRVQEFKDVVADGYTSRRAELRGAPSEGDDPLAGRIDRP